MTAPREVIDRQVAAYNRHDIGEFVSCYAPDARVLRADGSVLASGHEAIRSHYGPLFERSPSLHAEIRNRIEAGPVVVDEELVTGFVLPGTPTEIHAAVAYRVEDGLIRQAQLLT